MSDIGYKSKNQASLNIDYNSLDAYVNSLGEAINTPYPDYEKIGVLVDGHYRQLNSNILQIENEFYSIIRPKQIAMSCEKPTHALKTRGVRYVEMRSLDLDLFTPLGIDAEKAFFIEALLLSCMLNDSPDINEAEHQINNYNQLAVANSGRKPGLELKKINQTISLQDWANEILDAMQPVCAILDNDNSAKPYSKALQQQRLLVENPGLTPSARLIDCMTASNCGFAEFAHAKSVEHAAFFSNCLTDNDSFQKLSVLADESHQEQHEIEAADKLDFAAFLSAYFSGQLR
jgi:glutamate--cysteine ligase